MRSVWAIVTILAAAATVQDVSAKVKSLMLNAVKNADLRVVQEAWYVAQTGGYRGSIPLPPIQQCEFYRIFSFPYTTGGSKYIAEFDVPAYGYQMFYVFSFLYTGDGDSLQKSGGHSSSSEESSSSSSEESSSSSSEESSSSSESDESGLKDSADDFSDFDLRVLAIDDGTRLSKSK